MHFKLTNEQELGWRNGIPNRAGPYLYIPKAWTSWLPPLSQTTTNDMSPITLVFSAASRAVLPFVWHNDKITMHKSNGRNEYRIYISAAQASGQITVEPGDIIGFEPQLSNEFAAVVRVFQYRQGTPEYEQAMAMKEAGTNWQGPLIHPKHEAVQQETEVVAVDIKGLSEGIGNASSPDEALAGRISPAAFRDIVLAAYGRRCAITGKYIEVGSYLNLEAAHIRPVAHGGVNLPSNGIALSRDLHWAFDKGAFTLTTDGRVEVHPGIDEGELLSLKGSRISEPTAKFFAPSAEFVSYHRTHVFGLYLRSGQISAEGLSENF